MLKGYTVPRTPLGKSSLNPKRCYGIVGDTLNLIAHHINESDIEWVHVRHEEAGAFAAEAEAMLTGNLTAVAVSCGPGSLHFINGRVDANRNRAPVILIATQVASEELGFNFPQEVDFKAIYGSCSVFCDTIITPEQARRKTVIACQTAIAKGGVAVLIVPVDIAHADANDDVPYSVHTNVPIVRPNDADLDRAAEILNSGDRIAAHCLALSAYRHERKTPGVFESAPRHDGGGSADDIGAAEVPAWTPGDFHVRRWRSRHAVR